jgi:hydrogenase-4 membrane subunit HyfE
MTRRIGIIVAAAVLIAGSVFLLQGLRFLPSALMYGKPEWVVIGVAMDLIAAIVLFILTRQARRVDR